MRIAAAAVLTLALAFPAQGAPAPRRAALKLESTAPLVVTGRQFGAREPVLLTYLAADSTRRVIGVRASRSGSFRGTFTLRVDRCAEFTVRAVGLRGSRAVLQVEPACEKRGLAGVDGRLPVRLGHLAIVERLVEGGVVDALLARDLAQGAA